MANITLTLEGRMRKQMVRIAVVGMLAAGLAARAEAQTRPAAVKTASGQLGASINNAGLQQSFDLSVSKPITTSKNPWRSGAHVALGGTLAAMPAGVRGGGWAEFAPASVFVIRAGVEHGQYFGTSHSLTSFNTSLDKFDLDARKALDNAASGGTTKSYAALTCQIQSGHLAARSTVNIESWSSSVKGPLYYEPTRDTLLAVGGDTLSSISSALLYRSDLSGGGQFMVGPTHSVTYTDAKLNKIQKVGLVAVRQFAGRHLGLGRPSLTVQTHYYLDDPNKDGQWGAAMAIGFSLGRRRRRRVMWAVSSR